MPIAPIACQTRRLDREYRANLTFTDHSEQPLKPRTADAGSGAAEIIVDDGNVAPAKLSRTLRQPILPTPALVVMQQLVRRRLAYVDVSAA
jgi:hypothetical protein